MPFVNFSCQRCGAEKGRITARGPVSTTIPDCDSCLIPMIRAPKAPSGEVREIIDRPFQLKAVERPVDQARAIRNRDSEVPIK